MPDRDFLSVRVEGTDALDDLARRLRAEEGGRRLAANLARNLRRAMEPTRREAVGRLLAGTSKRPHPGAPLRATVAGGVHISVRTVGDTVGVALGVRDEPVNGLKGAPAKLNRKRGWRHPLFGNRERWYAQRGVPGWFSGPVWANRARYTQAIRDAMEAAARRITGGS